VNRADECEPVQADPTLLTQVLLNLCLNARDAMPGGGTLTLAAEAVEVSEEEAARLPGEARPGRFVRLTVEDTGCGMSDDVKARLYEPFFTTKGVGKGTGLGLPMVQGIVKQHRGWVTFTSTPGAGTRFHVYLPPAATLPPETPRPSTDLTRTPTPAVPRTATADSGISEKRTILLVDDEAMILEIGRLVLERAGFRVVTAGDGLEAVEVFRQEPGRFDLVILDVTMPRMSGRDAFRHLVEVDPAVRVLFSTGFSSEDLIELDGAAGLLGKPYRPNELLAAVQAALEGQPTSAG
jgi:CheY-like chemotaxis protein